MRSEGVHEQVILGAKESSSKTDAITLTLNV